jgi:hypothetical protein
MTRITVKKELGSEVKSYSPVVFKVSIPEY